MPPTTLQQRRRLALVPAACGLGVAVVLEVLSAGVEGVGATTLGFVVWNLLPHAVLAVVVLEVSEHAPRAWPALAVGVAVSAVVTVVVVAGLFVDPSSTGVLVFLFLPGYLLAVVIATAVAAAVTHRIRRPEASA